MHAIEIMGERYVKATDAAALTGYTTDYIGQLSRSGKIQAERVGRVWYVKESDIVSHKKGTARSNKRKTQESFRHQVKESSSQIHHVFFDPNAAYVPEYRKRLLSAEIRYEDDAHPLTPSPKKEHLKSKESEAVSHVSATPLSIELPVERMLDVASLEEEEHAEEPVAPRVHQEPPMRGAITLSEIEDELLAEDHEEIIPEENTETLRITPRKPQKSLVAYGKPSYAVMLPVARYLMPLLIVAAFGLSLGGVFLEQVMVYERGKSVVSRPYYEMSYGVRAVSTIAEAISW